MKRLVFTLISLFFMCEVTAATVSTSIHSECFLHISGEIDSKLSHEVLNKINLIKKDCEPDGSIFSEINISFDSMGGDVLEAIKLGKIIRDNYIHTGVNIKDSCASACVIAFLGGVHRVAVGRIGLHRPYSVEPSRSIEEARKTRDMINRELINYFKLMNIPSRLLDLINSVPSDQIMWLNDRKEAKNLDDIVGEMNKLQDLYIEGKDMVWVDMQVSILAKSLNISVQEFYSRKQKVNELCYNDIIIAEERLKCHNKVMNTPIAP